MRRARGNRRRRGGRYGSGPGRWTRLALARHRRWPAALAALLAVAAGGRALAPPEPAVEAVLVAASDLAAGQVVTAGDLRTARWPLGTAPEGALTAAAGRTLAAAVRAGEPLTDARVLGPGLLTGQPPGTLAVTVRAADPAATAAVAAGDRVDVLAAARDGGDGFGTATGPAEVLATAALVLSAGGAEATSGGGALGGLAGTTGEDTDDAGLLVLGVDRETAARLAGATAGSLTVALRAPPEDG